MKTLHRLFKSPVLHFLLIGALLFTLHRAWRVSSLHHAEPQKEVLVIGKQQIKKIKKDIRIQTGIQATRPQIEAAIQKAIDDEILYRQALNNRLDRNNPSIRHRLIQVARFISENPLASDTFHYRKALELGLDRRDPVIKRHLISMMSLVAKKIPSAQAPSRVSQEELQAYLNQHPQTFMKPKQLKFVQIYFSRDKRGSKTESEAHLLLKQLREEALKPTEAFDLGDPFLQGNHFSWLNDSALERLFGPIFSRQLAKLEVGKWLGPLPSSYGWHLIFIEEARPAQVPPLETVASQVRGAILKEREQQRLIDRLREFRSRYSIRVEDGESNVHGQI